MAVDEELAQAYRGSLEGLVGLSEKNMMGGTCFMLNGNMVGGAHRDKNGTGFFMFRVGKDNDEEAAKLGTGTPLVQGGRKMTGFYFVESDGCPGEVFEAWKSLAVSNAMSLPPK